MSTTNLAEITTDPTLREFPEFDLVRLLGTVFDPTEGCRVCILIDAEDPAAEMEGYAFLNRPGREVQSKAYEEFFLGLKDGAMQELGMTGGEMFCYKMSYGSNLDLEDACWDAAGNELSLERDIYPKYRPHPLHIDLQRNRATDREVQDPRLPRGDHARTQRCDPQHRSGGRL